MEVGSVSSSVNAAVSSQLRARPTDQDQQAQKTQQTQQAKNDRSVVDNEAAERARIEAQTNQTNRPSVNTSGQAVGTRINVTA